MPFQLTSTSTWISMKSNNIITLIRVYYHPLSCCFQRIFWKPITSSLHSPEHKLNIAFTNRIFMTRWTDFYILHFHENVKCNCVCIIMWRFNDVDGIVKTFPWIRYVMSFLKCKYRRYEVMCCWCVYVYVIKRKLLETWSLISKSETKFCHMKIIAMENIFRGINILAIENVNRQWTKWMENEHYVPSRWPYSMYIACLHVARALVAGFVRIINTGTPDQEWLKNLTRNILLSSVLSVIKIACSTMLMSQCFCS